MRRYALLIGVEEYRDQVISRLNFARADAIALGKRLRGRCGFDSVRVLADESGDDEPLLLNIVSALRDVASELEPEDLFLFFFAGHGVEKEGHGYLLARDSLQAFPEHGSLSLELLRKTFKSFVAGQRILLLDACRNSPDAGRSDSDNRMGDAISRDIVAAARTKPVAGQTTVLFSACRAGQRAYEWPGKGQGVFTHYLLDGLDGAAWTDNGLEFSRLAQHTAARVRRWSAQTPGLAIPQEPWYEQFGDPQPVMLATGAVAPSPAVTPPQERTRPEPKSEPAKPKPPGESSTDIAALVKALDEARKYYQPTSEKVAAAEQALRRAVFDERVPRLRDLMDRRKELAAEMRPAHPKMKELADRINAERRELGTAAETLAPALTEDERQELYGLVLARVYTEWPFEAAEAKRRQEETAAALRIPVKKAIDIGGGVEMDLVLIPAGAFMMGSKDGDDDEKPVHKVGITKPFYMSKTEVTQEQWERITGHSVRDQRDKANKDWPLRGEGKSHPMYYVSWNDCREFARKLSAKVAGLTFSLPTEAEWEYACRAGTDTPFHTGETISTDEANYDGDSTYGTGRKGEDRSKTIPVGSFKPNAFGLYDMHGNVYEWCEDWHDEDYYKNSPKEDPEGPRTGEDRVLRGGSWGRYPRGCRSADRGRSNPAARGSDSGCRVVVRDVH